MAARDAAAPMVRFEGVCSAPPPPRGGAMPAALPAALRDLDLEVRRGELLVLLGPAGAGKTTALKLLAGLRRPRAGRILIEGRDLAGLPPHRRGLGAMFQGAALLPRLSVAENLALPLAVRGARRAERAARVARALAELRIEDCAGLRPGQLSDGQRQRAALACALVAGAPVVLLDEPLGALDQGPRQELRFELRALQRRLRATMLYATRDPQEALALADRVAVIDRGRLRQLAPPRALYDAPENVFVAGYVGENNLLPGTVLGPGEESAADCRVRLDVGLEVEAQVADAGGAGSRCVVAVRPERVAIAAIPARDFGAEGEGGVLAAMVIESQFLGDHVRLTVSLGDRGEIVAKRPVMGPPPPVPGTHVSVAWQAANARAFRPDGQG